MDEKLIYWVDEPDVPFDEEDIEAEAEADQLGTYDISWENRKTSMSKVQKKE